jgi:transcriptional regulator with XRE-family HTH domain
MSESNRKLQYKVLGHQLRLLREKLHESLLEVSGAVEIDLSLLTQIERGERQPNEDILLLLLNHLKASDDQAVRLWELAGYDQSDMSSNDESASKPVVVIIGSDSRVMYTDQFAVTVKPNGLVLNFLQDQGADNPTVVSRLGMSRQQAGNLMMGLHQALNDQPHPRQRFLPPSGEQPKA